MDEFCFNIEDTVTMSWGSKSPWGAAQCTGARVIHKPSGIDAKCDDHNSQHRNRYECFKEIHEKLLERELPITFDMPFTIECKRMEFPLVEVNCNNCGDKLDLFGDYLSYPVVGEEFHHSVYCHHCEHLNHYTLNLSMTASAKFKGVEKE